MSSSLPKSASAVIVGAGCVGAATAYHLAIRGYTDIVVLDRGLIASGPTGRSGAQLIPRSDDFQLTELKLEGLRFYQNFEELTGHSAEFHQTGYLAITPRSGEAALEKAHENLAAHGASSHYYSVGAGTDIHEGGVQVAEDEAALFVPDVGYVDPVAAAWGLLRSAESRGAAIFELTEATRLRVRNDSVTVVETVAGNIACDRVILCAGIWTNRLMEPLGFHLPLALRRVEVGIFRAATRLMAHPIIADFVTRIYARPDGDGFAWVGRVPPRRGSEFAEVSDPDKYDSQVHPAEMQQLLNKLSRRVPAFIDGYWRRGHTCVYDVTPDWAPVVSHGEFLGNLHIACGSSGAGFVLSTALGRMLSEGVSGGVDVDDVFSINRFESGARNWDSL